MPPRTRQEEEAQLMAAILASLEEIEARNDRETGRTSSHWSSDRDSYETRDMIPSRTRRRGYAEEEFIDNYSFPQKRLQQAHGEMC